MLTDGNSLRTNSSPSACERGGVSGGARHVRAAGTLVRWNSEGASFTAPLADTCTSRSTPASRAICAPHPSALCAAGPSKRGESRTCAIMAG
jgi:hypothetical protein